jgi:hypothetical protein
LINFGGAGYSSATVGTTGAPGGFNLVAYGIGLVAKRRLICAVADEKKLPAFTSSMIISKNMEKIRSRLN